MEKSLKTKALTQLAGTAGVISQEALKKASQEIALRLAEESDYEQLDANLEFLEAISYRVAEDALEICKNLLKRLETLKITYEEVPGYPASEQGKYRNSKTLTNQIIEIVDRVRYHNPEAALDLLLPLSIHNDENVRNEATRSLEKLGKYNLHVFYGDGDKWAGLGVGPQVIILKKIIALSEAEIEKYCAGILKLCDAILSPMVEGQEWTSKAVTISSGALPGIPELKKLRGEVLDFLFALYFRTKNPKMKGSILGTVNDATRFPHVGKVSEDLKAIIIGDTLKVLSFMKDAIYDASLETLEDIEHRAFYIHYHGQAKEIQESAIEIDIRLKQNSEYQIFKTLVGFDGIFHEWGDSRVDAIDAEKIYRETAAKQFASEINEETYDVWARRISSYASIQSNDLATFIYFGKFLESFGETAPDLAMRLLLQDQNLAERFMPIILIGASKSNDRQKIRSQMLQWAKLEKHLFSIARTLEYLPDLDLELTQIVFEGAIKQKDEYALVQLFATLSVHYDTHNLTVIDNFMVPIIQFLTERKSNAWLNAFWFRKERAKIIGDMNDNAKCVILENLKQLNHIDYHSEEILAEIGKKSPELLIDFMIERVRKEPHNDTEERFEAVPWHMEHIAEALRQKPTELLDKALQLYDEDYGMFMFRGAKLLQSVFGDFPKSFEEALLKKITDGNEETIKPILAILRNYEGETFLHDFIKILIKKLPKDSKLLVEIMVALETTGVVHGEYGLSEAYARKIEEVRNWLTDKDEKVVSFATTYIANLEKQTDHERKRAEEEILLRKRAYGEA